MIFIVIVAAMQFVNVLDFVMVTPLGNDFVRELGMSTSQTGDVAGTYTLAAFIAGLVGSIALDRYDRKRVLLYAGLGLSVATIAGGFAWNAPSMLAARFVAGFFGGPATAAGLAIIADVVPSERRGRAMGTVMSAFSIASVVGIPSALKLSHAVGWRAPFFIVGCLGLAVTFAASFKLPSMTLHLARGIPPVSVPRLVRIATRPLALLAYAAAFISTSSAFLLMPNFPMFLQTNLGVPRAELGNLYFYGGFISFATVMIAGRFVDRAGSTIAVTVSTLLFVANVYLFSVLVPSPLPVRVSFFFFMGILPLRNVAASTLYANVPSLEERAGYNSLQSAVQHLGLSVGSIVGARLLSSNASGALVGMPRLAWIAIASSVLIVPLIAMLEKRLVARDAAAKAASARLEQAAGAVEVAAHS